MLAGGPARENTSDLFHLHVEGLQAQDLTVSVPNDVDLQIIRPCTIHHELVPPVEEGDPRWHKAKIERVAKARQTMMDKAVYVNAPQPDALFMVDTDVILGPGVLQRMWEVDADVVYGVFWTDDDWGQPGPVAPQVWTNHPYQTNDKVWRELNTPGVHEIEVRGGGACTLIRGRGFESKYYPLLQSLSHLPGMWIGEDRTFCLGLECRDIRQVAVTGLPIAHAWNETYKTKEWLDVLRREVGL